MFPQSLFLFLFLKISKKYELNFRDYMEANVSVESVDSIPVCGGPGTTAPLAPPYIQLCSRSQGND
jgi:hypothetical protein